MDKPNVGGRAFVIRGAVLALATLAFASCGADTLGGAGTPGGGAGVITLVASGGPAGSVTADVALDEPGVGPQDTCAAPLVAGACQLTSCQSAGVGSPAAGYGNFGPIAVTVGTTTVPLTYDLTGYPAVALPAPAALGTGGTMRFRGGDGLSVPTFDVSATIPGLGVMSSPNPASEGVAAILDSSQDLPVTWTPISIGQIKFRLDGEVITTDSDVMNSIHCTFDGAPGSAVVPQTLLAAMTAMRGPVEEPVYAALISELDATTVVDGLTIVTHSFQTTADPAGGFPVTLR
jgi:hypothetical protein